MTTYGQPNIFNGALSAAVSVYGQPCTLTSLSVFDTKANDSGNWLHFFDIADNDITDQTPVFSVPISAATPVINPFSIPLRFTNGMCFAITEGPTSATVANYTAGQIIINIGRAGDA